MSADPFSLHGKTGIVTGLANADSIAYGCARALHQAGAELLLTYGSPKADKHVLPLAAELGDAEALLCDVQEDAGVDALFARAAARWDKLDFLIHSMAFALKDDLHGRVVDCSREGFALAMDISCHSFIRLAKRAEPLLKEGGTLITLSYYGAEKVVDNYNLMGPIKAALEASVRYMAAELGPRGIRVHAISPGPIKTRAASGIAHFDQLLESAESRAPLRRLATSEDVGRTAVYLASQAGSGLTGSTTYVDAGVNVRA
ncbi:enoyl-ACP reductase FabI [Thiocapsa rosea]|uniref:Enoyl-[acyl-carrier-protein] reductase [NADH] n=1 Tax=Thiocapsa rosea TaxID=69360 RepID=A0A495VFF6_9GAMM|nr:enoyl-ACP reductase FabI [Thiocapsa rosea]RKT47157.1 enoyl-[acyl-carrier-protein] reductase [NADH] [Thiocapsa rosea]